MSWKKVTSQPTGVEFSDWYSFKDYWFKKELELPRYENGGIAELYGRGGEGGGTIVLEAVKVIEPPVVPPFEMYPPSIVPPRIQDPTASLVGDEYGGGGGRPWSNGPYSMLSSPVTIGTLLFYVGQRVAVSLAVRGANDLYSALKVKYHQRNAYLKVHTGVGGIGAGGGSMAAVVRPDPVSPGSRPLGMSSPGLRGGIYGVRSAFAAELADELGASLENWWLPMFDALNPFSDNFFMDWYGG